MQTIMRTTLFVLALVPWGTESALAQAYPPPASGPPPAGSPPLASNPPSQSGQYSSNEVIDAGHRFFGTISRGLGEIVEKAGSQWGLPNGYVLGQGPDEGTEDDAHGDFVEAEVLTDDRRHGRDVHPIKIGDEVHQADQEEYVPPTDARMCSLGLHDAFSLLSSPPMALGLHSGERGWPFRGSHPWSMTWAVIRLGHPAPRWGD
jgi:hypothetical protein